VTASREGAREALIVAVSDYQDRNFRRLRAPAADAKHLAEVLVDPNIGGFRVHVLTNPAERQLRRELATFFRIERRPEDLLLVHFSCHGVKDASGELYFAASDTEKDLLEATCIESKWLNDRLNRCRSKRIVVLLDCCYSGAFPFGVHARADDDVNAPAHFDGHGRVVITASSSMEYAYEGDQLTTEKPKPSVFTAAVIQGLRTGEADRDHDKRISIQDLYDYVFERIHDTTPEQTPNMMSKLEGPLYIARSSYEPQVAPATLDQQLIGLINSPLAGGRLGAVEELARLLHSPDRATALAARQALDRMATDDSRQVAERAAAALGEAGDAEEQEPARRGAKHQAWPEKPPIPPAAREKQPAPSVSRTTSRPPQSKAVVLVRRPKTLAVAGGFLACIAIITALLTTGSNRPTTAAKTAARDSSTKTGATTRTGATTTTGSASASSPATKTIAVGKNPQGIAVGQGSVWVTNEKDNTVTRIDASTGKVLGSPIRVGRDPTGIAVGQGSVWVTNFSDDTVSRIDASTGKVLGSPIRVGSGPYGVAVGQGSVWVANFGAPSQGAPRDNTVSWIDASTGKVRGTIAVGGTPIGIAVGQGSVWVTDYNSAGDPVHAGSGDTVSWIDANTGQVRGTIRVGSGPLGVAVGQGSVWVTHLGGVSRIATSTGKVLGSPIRVGPGGGETVAVGQGSVWVTNPSDNTISRIDASTGKVLGSPIRLGRPGGTGPGGVAVGQGSVWVTNPSDNTVRRIDATTSNPIGKSNPNVQTWIGVFDLAYGPNVPRVTIRLVAGKPTVVSVGTSKERFIVRSSNWNGSGLEWTYYVPSTDSLVTESCQVQPPPVNILCEWVSDNGDSGGYILYPVRGQ